MCRFWTILIVLLVAVSFNVSATDYVMTGNGIVSTDFPASPGAIPAGGASPNYSYGTLSHTLDMVTHNILATGDLYNATFTFSTITNSGGGDFVFNSPTTAGADLSISASDAITVGAIDTRGVSVVALTVAGGNVTINCSGGDIYAASIDASGSDNVDKGLGGGTVNISSAGKITVSGKIDSRSTGTVGTGAGADITLNSGGNITVGGTIDTGGSGSGGGTASGKINITAAGSVTTAHITTRTGKGASPITVTGAVVNVSGNVDASSAGSNAGGSNIKIASTAGGITIVSNLTVTSGQGTGGNIQLDAAGNLSVGGEIDARGKRFRAGSVDISANGDIVITGVVSTAMWADDSNPDLDGGPVSIWAAGAITLEGGIDTYTIGTNHNTTFDEAGSIAITSSTDSVTICGDINADSPKTTNGNLTVWAPNGIITLGNLNVTNLNLITLEAGMHGLIVTGDIDGLIITEGPKTVKGGFKASSISGDILYSEAANADDVLIGNYSILDKDTGLDTGYYLVNKFPTATIIMVK